jgi:hypothetical protein
MVALALCASSMRLMTFSFSMARLAGMRLRERYHDWDRGPFAGESQSHISACEVTAAPGG